MSSGLAPQISVHKWNTSSSSGPSQQQDTPKAECSYRTVLISSALNNNGHSAINSQSPSTSTQVYSNSPVTKIPFVQLSTKCEGQSHSSAQVYVAKPINVQYLKVINVPAAGLSQAAFAPQTFRAMHNNSFSASCNELIPSAASVVDVSSVPSSSTVLNNSAVPIYKSTSRTRKPCNCSRSMCLKLYCDCFANGEFCRDCHCVNCHNNLIHEQERSRAIKQVLERNPNAFHPKIGKGEDQEETERQHKKGCHCKKSGCLKNYCECYEAKITCTYRCKCVGCQNTDSRHSRRPQGSLKLLATSETDFLRNVKRQMGYPGRETGKLGSNSPSSSHSSIPTSVPPKMPASFLTDDVVEATTMCLSVAGTLEESKTSSDSDIECAVISEFGRCLQQVFTSSLY